MARRKNLTDAEKTQLRELWEQGLTIKEVSKKMELKYGTVNNWFSAYNAGFNSITDYQNFRTIQAGYPTPRSRYPEKSLQQKFEDSIFHFPYRDLLSKLEKQESESPKVACCYELDAIELVPKLLDELGKTKKGERDVTILREYYFDSKTDYQIGKMVGRRKMSYQASNELRHKALNKLRKIIQGKEFTEMFC